MKEKVSLEFVAKAKGAVEKEFEKLYKHNRGIATRKQSYTVFEKDGECIVLTGLVHDEVDAPSIEFQMQKRFEDVYIERQRIHHS